MPSDRERDKEARRQERIERATRDVEARRAAANRLTAREDIAIPEAALAQIEADARQAVESATAAAAGLHAARQDAIIGPLSAAILEKIDYARGREYTRVNMIEKAENAMREWGA